MGVAAGGDHRMVAEDFLHFEQVDARFDQMGGIVAKAVRRNSFFKPISAATWRNACCTPPRSMCVVALDAPLRPYLAAGKQQYRVAVYFPELAQHFQRMVRQGHQAVPVTLGIADMHPHPPRIEIAHPQLQPFPQAQAHAVQGKKEHPVAEHPRRINDLLHLRHRHDVRQTRHLGRFGQFGTRPGFVQHIGVIKFQPIQIVLERAPRQMIQNPREIIGQLIFVQVVDAVIEMRGSPAHAVAVRFDRLGPHAAQLQTLEQALVMLRKWLWKLVCHHHSPRGKVQKPPCGVEENDGLESN